MLFLKYIPCTVFFVSYLSFLSLTIWQKQIFGTMEQNLRHIA